jgi:hypothetical protein
LLAAVDVEVMYSKVVQKLKGDVNVWQDVVVLWALKDDAEDREQEILGIMGMRIYPSFLGKCIQYACNISNRYISAFFLPYRLRKRDMIIKVVEERLRQWFEYVSFLSLNMHLVDTHEARCCCLLLWQQVQNNLAGAFSVWLVAE